MAMVAQLRGALSRFAPLSLDMVAPRRCAPSCHGGLRRRLPVAVGAACSSISCRCRRWPVAQRRGAFSLRCSCRSPVAQRRGAFFLVVGLPLPLTLTAQLQRALPSRALVPPPFAMRLFSCVVPLPSLAMVAQLRSALSRFVPLSLRMVAPRRCAPSCLGDLRRRWPVAVGAACSPLLCWCRRWPGWRNGLRHVLPSPCCHSPQDGSAAQLAPSPFASVAQWLGDFLSRDASVAGQDGSAALCDVLSWRHRRWP